MKISPVDRITLYGIRSNHQNTLEDVKKVVRQIYPLDNTVLEVYTSVDDIGNKVHKLYYLKDKLGNWIKSKLVYFENNKRYKTIRSEKRRRNYGL